MAVIANKNEIKILATDHGLNLFQTTKKNSVDPSRETLKTLEKVSIMNSLFLMEDFFICLIRLLKIYSASMLINTCRLQPIGLQLQVMLN